MSNWYLGNKLCVIQLHSILRRVDGLRVGEFLSILRYGFMHMLSRLLKRQRVSQEYYPASRALSIMYPALNICILYSGARPNDVFNDNLLAFILAFAKLVCLPIKNHVPSLLNGISLSISRFVHHYLRPCTVGGQV